MTPSKSYTSTKSKLDKGTMVLSAEEDRTSWELAASMTGSSNSNTNKPIGLMSPPSEPASEPESFHLNSKIYELEGLRHSPKGLLNDNRTNSINGAPTNGITTTSPPTISTTPTSFNSGVNSTINGHFSHQPEQYHSSEDINLIHRTSLSNPQPYQPTHHRTKSFSAVAIGTLVPPVSITLIILCLCWYLTSAIANTLAKTILDAFPYAVTLSMGQFLIAVICGIMTISLAQISHRFRALLPSGTVSGAGFRYPTREILLTTAPMGVFQLSGHIFSHLATSIIPVSLVHTIKALSPLFTVSAYRILFSVKYRPSTYLTLIPLTAGVIMTCSTEFRAHFRGIMYALFAALIFVSQNMFSKKLLTPSSISGPKLDKLNILCYCSSLAFLFTFPLWLFSDGLRIYKDYSSGSGQFFNESSAKTATISNWHLLAAFLANGLVHFLQNILAFQVLGMVSPVTYSVASLIKRIVVITVAILWFGQVVTAVQGWGILLTFTGLYLYDRFGGDPKKYVEQRPVMPK